jgi:hypothetical protein
MVRLTLVSLTALLAAALTSPAFAAGQVAPCPGSGMGARDAPAAQMGEMGLHHHAHQRHYHHAYQGYHHHSRRYTGDGVTRQLNRQEYASHMGPGVGYTTPAVSMPEVNRMPTPPGVTSYPSGYGYQTPAVSIPEVNRR